ncbi:MAG: hypothetical protein ACP5T3_00735 [Candidatus Micrarchaeia archaeon]
MDNDAISVEKSAPAKSAGNIASSNSDEYGRVWLVGELGGGLVWFDKYNLLGLYEELRERSELKRGIPHTIIFLGELLPKIPDYITRGGSNLTESLHEGISSLDLAVVEMKPHLARIEDLLLACDVQANLVYTMGPSDTYNIKHIHDLIVKVYFYTPSELGNMLLAYEDKISYNNRIIKTTEEQLNAVEQSSGPDGEEREQRINNLRVKLKQLKEENGDYKDVVNQLEHVVDLWINENARKGVRYIYDKLNPGDSERLDQLIASSLPSEQIVELHEAYEKVSKDLAKAASEKEKYPDKFRALEREAKRLADLLKKVSYGKIREAEKEAKTSVHESGKAGELFTHNISGSPELSKSARGIAELTVKIAIRNAFGRRIHLMIADKLVNDVVLPSTGSKNIIFRIADAPTNTSETYTDPKKRLDAEAHFEGAKAMVVAMAHSSIGAVYADPKSNRPRGNSGMLYEVSVPPMVSFSSVQKAWLNGIKTPLTEVVGRGQGITAGFFEVKIGKHGVSFDFNTAAYLHENARKVVEVERAALYKRLAELANKSNGMEEPSIEDVLQMRNKLPSEMNDELFKKAVRHKKEVLAEYESELPSATARYGETKHMRILMINDTHIGTSGYGIPTVYLLDALVAYIKENGLDNNLMLFFGGDNIEGDYKSIKNETNTETNITNVFDYKEYLGNAGLTPKQINSHVKSYESYLLYKQPIQNIDQQVRVLIEHVKPLISENTAAIVLVSGQHFNKTYPNKDRDEATTIQIYLAPVAELAGMRSKIVAIPGGDKGAGDVEIEQGVVAYVAHAGKVERMKIGNEYLMALSADEHVHKIKFVTTPEQNTILEACGAASSVLTNFATEMGITTNQDTRGFTFIDVTYALSGTGPVLLKAESRLIGMEQLEKHMVKPPKTVTDFEKELVSLVRASSTDSKRERVA